MTRKFYLVLSYHFWIKLGSNPGLPDNLYSKQPFNPWRHGLVVKDWPLVEKGRFFKNNLNDKEAVTDMNKHILKGHDEVKCWIQLLSSCHPLFNIFFSIQTFFWLIQTSKKLWMDSDRDDLDLQVYIFCFGRGVEWSFKMSNYRLVRIGKIKPEHSPGIKMTIWELVEPGAQLRIELSSSVI